MTPQQVQFCYAIARGQAARARELISKIDVNQNNDWGCSPALLCLWALNRDPKMLAKKLEEFFPKVHDNFISRLIPASQNAMDDIIRKVLLPSLKRNLNQVLKPIGLKVVSLNRISDNKQDTFIDTAFGAVNVIINDEFFDDINASQRRFAENLFSKLLPLVEKIQTQVKAVATKHDAPQTDKPSKDQPYTIQLLMAILNGKPHTLPNMPSLNLQATLAPIGRTYLPGSISLAQKAAPTHCHAEAKREEEDFKYRHRMAPGIH